MVRSHNAEFVSSDILSKVIFSREMKDFLSKMTLVIVNIVKIINVMSKGQRILLFFIKIKFAIFPLNRMQHLFVFTIPFLKVYHFVMK